MKQLKSLIRENSFLVSLILIFTLFKLFIALFMSHIIWDEAVYVGMGKYIYSFGENGFFEITRPFGLSLILGLFWKIGLNVIIAGRLIAITAGIASIIITYILSKEIFNKKIANIAAILLFLTPLFVHNSSKILSGIPATFIMLLALYFIINNNYLIAGLLSAVAFLFRFPLGLLIIAVGIVLLIELLYNKNFKEFFIRCVKYYGAFILLVLPYLIFNYTRYIGEVSKLHHAIFRPFIYASSTITESNVFLYDFGYAFYLVELLKENIFLIFAVVGIILFFYKKLYGNTKYNLIFISLFVLSFYFTQLPHKELRYSLPFVPFLAIVAAYGIYTSFNYFNKKKLNYVIVMILLVLLATFSVSSFFNYYKYKVPFNQKPLIDKENYHLISGNVLSTSPLLTAYIDNHIELNFYSLDQSIKTYRTDSSIKTLILMPDIFICHPEDEQCIDNKNNLIKSLILTDNLVYYTYYRENHYLFFNKDVGSMENSEKLKVLSNLNIHFEKTKISNTLDDSKLIVFIAEDVADVDRSDDLGNIWEFDNFVKLNDLFNNTKISWNIIPIDMIDLNDESKSYLLGSYNPKTTHIIQNGYDHKDNGRSSEFKGLDLTEQQERISDGKNILESTFNTQINTFMPPFNSADKITTEVLDDKKYNTYLTNSGDPITFENTNINRYNINIPFAESWNANNIKSLETLKEEFDFYYLYHDYMTLIFSYQWFDNTDFENLNSFLEYIKSKDTTIITLDELDSWQRFRNNLSINVDSTTISINTGSDRIYPITLLFYDSGSYSLDGNYFSKTGNFSIKNKADYEIETCLNTNCSSLEPGELMSIHNT